MEEARSFYSKYHEPGLSYLFTNFFIVETTACNITRKL